MPLLTTYNAASIRGFTGFVTDIPELHFSVNTALVSAGAPVNSVRIQFITPADGGINVTFGDGTSQTLGQNISVTVTKTYPSSGVYNIKMTGKGAIKVIDAGRLSNLYSWGTQFFWTDCINAFKNGVNFRNSTTNPNDYPRFANSLSCSGMFDGCYNWNLGNVSRWNTTNVTDMSFMFRGCYEFLRSFGGIESWDVSNVTNMQSMFDGCGNFGSSGGLTNWNWNTVNVTNMSYMFANMFAGWTASLNWDTSNVTTMEGMFKNGAYSRSDNTGGICNWNVGNVTNMSNMFYGNRNMNSNLANWNTSKVTDMSYMFGGVNSLTAHNFNQPIGNWNTSNVTNMEGIFRFSLFNQNINNWNVSKVTNMISVFEQAYSFNQPLNNWDTAEVTTMLRMFESALAFNQSIESFNTSKVTNMNRMFMNANSFNQPLGLWDVSKVTSMSQMFNNTSGLMVFNQNLSTWCVTNFPGPPVLFANGMTSWTLPKPPWGTCPDQPMLFEVSFPAAGQVNQYRTGFDILPHASGYPPCTIDWGDGSPIETYTLANTVSHTYANVPGTYRVAVTYALGLEWRELSSLRKILSWGSIPVAQLKFLGCVNLTTVSSPTPPKLQKRLTTLGSVLDGAFQDCTSLTGGTGFNNWSIPPDSTLNNMFLNATSFNWDLSRWCVPWRDTQPTNFSTATPAWTLPKPVWGSCIQSTALAWYDFNNDYSYPPPQTGTTVIDITRKGNNGTISNAPWSGTTGANAEGSLAFNGSTSQISIASIPSMSLSTANPVTMQLWVRLNNASSQQVLLSKWTTPSEGYRLYINSNSRQIITQIFVDGTQYAASSGLNILNDDTWYLITWVVQLGFVNRVYLNTSVIIGAVPPSGTMNESNPLLIGNTQPADLPGLNGRVGGFWFYPRQLDQIEIDSNFNNTKTRYGY